MFTTLSDTLFSLNGRIARLPYFLLSLGVYVAILLGAVVVIATAAESPALAIMMGIVLGVLLIWSSVALTIKRLHDMGMSGIHYLWVITVTMFSVAGGDTGIGIFFSIVNGAITLWLVFNPGQPMANKYGLEPV